MFDFIKPLTTQDFHQDIEYLIDGFIPKRMITMLFADGGNGKSWLAMAIAKHAVMFRSGLPQGSMKVIYFDADNSISTLKERGIEHKLIAAHPEVTYCHRSKMELEPLQMLDEMQKNAYGQAYDNTLIILDSLRDFADVNNDLAAMRVGEKLKSIRDAGATVIVLHHTTKNGSNYQGSNNLRNSVDNMFRVIKADSPADEFNWLLEPVKERAAIRETAIRVDIDDLMLTEMDVEEVKLDDETKDFIEQVKTVLNDRGSLNKKELMEACGYKKDNKPVRDKLTKFDGIHWQSERVNRVYIYSLI